LGGSATLVRRKCLCGERAGENVVWQGGLAWGASPSPTVCGSAGVRARDRGSCLSEREECGGKSEAARKKKPCSGTGLRRRLGTATNRPSQRERVKYREGCRFYKSSQRRLFLRLSLRICSEDGRVLKESEGVMPGEKKKIFLSKGTLSPCRLIKGSGKIRDGQRGPSPSPRCAEKIECERSPKNLSKSRSA